MQGPEFAPEQPTGSPYSKVVVKGNKLLITNNRLARIIALGVGVEREARRRAVRRRMERSSRRRNRSN